MRQLMYSFAGQHPPQEMLEGVRQGTITSFCLFAHWNVESPAQLRELTEALHRAAAEGGHPPPLVDIDQEGGQLIPVTGGATELPGNMPLGATRSPELAEQAGHVLGRELRALGVNLNFAPSLDVNINPDNPVVGVRSFGADSQRVAELGTAMIRGMQDEGVLATAKHFPGHGDTAADSHHAAPVIGFSRERMDTVELRPFRAAIKAGVDAIMPAHIIFTTLDSQWPATLSENVLTHYLRQELGFEKLIISDAMDMYAVAHYGAAESVRRALAAGNDLVMLAHLPEQHALAAQMQHLEQPAALARIQAARQNVPRELLSFDVFDVIDSRAHHEIAQQIANRSIMLVRGGERLPLRLGADESILVITPQPVDLTPANTSSEAQIRLAEAIRQRHPRIQAFELPHRYDDSTLNAALRLARQANIVIVGTINADQDTQQAALVQALHVQGYAPIVVALRTPYDLRAFSQVETYLCAYGIRDVTTEAVARVLFGEIEATGMLPCPTPGISETEQPTH